MIRTMRLVDRVAIAYTLGMSGLMAVGGAGAPGLGPRLLIHAAVVVGILLILRYQHAGKALVTARALYPLPLLLFRWGQLEFQIPLLWGNYWATDCVVAGPRTAWSPPTWRFSAASRRCSYRPG